MKNKKDVLEVDLIGGLGSLTKEDEQKLSEYFKNKKKSQSKITPIKRTTKTKSAKL